MFTQIITRANQQICSLRKKSQHTKLCIKSQKWYQMFVTEQLSHSQFHSSATASGIITHKLLIVDFQSKVWFKPLFFEIRVRSTCFLCQAEVVLIYWNLICQINILYNSQFLVWKVVQLIRQNQVPMNDLENSMCWCWSVDSKLTVRIIILLDSTWGAPHSAGLNLTGL